jgi:hypothetical protein
LLRCEVTTIVVETMNADLPPGTLQLGHSRVLDLIVTLWDEIPR